VPAAAADRRGRHRMGLETVAESAQECKRKLQFGPAERKVAVLLFDTVNNAMIHNRRGRIEQESLRYLPSGFILPSARRRGNKGRGGK